MLGGETKSSLVKAAAGKELAARREGNAVHRFLVPVHQAGHAGHARRYQHHCSYLLDIKSPLP